MIRTIAIVSGEGAGPGHIEPHTGKPTHRAVLARLVKERDGGDRWAYAQVDGERVEDRDLEYLLKTEVRSGTQWGDAQYAAKGYGRLSLRLPVDTLEMLESKAESEGCSRAQLVDDAIRQFRG